MASAASGYSKYTVDLWWTDLNPTEVGIFQHTRHRAKSRQFSKDSDVIGAVKVNGERTGLLTYREGLWNESEGLEKRLVVKLFSEEMSWRGTMDMLMGRSLQLTLGANGFPVPAFLINISGHDQIVNVERSARKWPLIPENYSFFILDDKTPALLPAATRLDQHRAGLHALRRAQREGRASQRARPQSRRSLGRQGPRGSR